MYVSWVYWVYFDVKLDDVYWCMVDFVWVIVYMYEIYGLLLNGFMQVIYEGMLDVLYCECYFEIIECYGVMVYYMVFMLICMFMIWFGFVFLVGYDFFILWLFGIVGEVINFEVWVWFCWNFGCDELFVIDIWWQFEIGVVMIVLLLGVMSFKFGLVFVLLLGIDVVVVDEDGVEVFFGWFGMLVVC